MSDKLSFTGKRWVLREDAPQTGLHPQKLLFALFTSRGIHPKAKEELIPPTALNDIQKAHQRIKKAIDNSESIGIFGDYDCDGITATLQLVRFFKRRGIDPLVRLPHRVHDGYGLKAHIVEELLEKGIKLLITVDTGTGSVREVRRAKEAGMDVVITDHHHVGRTLPPACAIVHPALSPDYPQPYPSGAGVVFHLIRAIEGEEWEDMHHDQALAMLGIIADVMELKNQNRLMVQLGLTALKELKDEPLAQLITQAGLNKDYVTSTDVAFRIAPRINAAGRMADPIIGFNALSEGGEAIITLELLNEQRQKLTEKLLNETLKYLGPSPDAPILSIIHEDFPQGVVGLLAGKLTEMFGKPSLVGRIREEKCTASLRSIPAYHITAGLEKCSDLLQYFGGHAQAAGCTFSVDAFDELTKRLSEDISANTRPQELLPTINIDAVLSPLTITQKFCEELNHLEPFGQGNPEPIFLLENVKLDYARCIGKENNHLQGNIAGAKAVGFRLSHLLEKLDQPVDIACRLGTDTWNGRTRPQVFIEDIRAPVRDSLKVC